MMTEDAIAMMQSQHRRKRLMIRIGIFLLILVLIPVLYVGFYMIRFYPKIKSGELTSYDQVRFSGTLSKPGALSTLPAEDLSVLVPTGTIREFGKKDAALTIVEFIDYQCPYCQEMVMPIKQLMTTHADKIHFVVRDFPVTELHPDARNASLAARCALDQGQTAYWRFQDLMFGDQSHLSLDDLRAKASLAKINVARFDECVTSRVFDLEIDRDIEFGKKIGVQGTPTYFFNGVKVEGSMKGEQFEALINATLDQLGE